MEPSGSLDPAELKLIVSGTIPDVGFADAAAMGEAFGVPAGNTSSVILCAGAVKVTLEPVKGGSEEAPAAGIETADGGWLPLHVGWATRRGGGGELARSRGRELAGYLGVPFVDRAATGAAPAAPSPPPQAPAPVPVP